jgi:hypothetical protein
MQSGGKRLTYIMMVAICNLHVEYGHCTVKQMYKNVLNNAVKVTNGIVGHPLYSHQNYGQYWHM